MDPSSVLRAIWTQRWYVLPALVITLVGVIYMFQFGPRYYESTISYALANPDTPTEAEIEENPELGQLNSDNPYLRSSNPALITDVVFTRLSSSTTVEALDARGLSSEYSVVRGETGNGFLLDITGEGTSPEESVATTSALGDMLVEDLRAVQTINGADDEYLFTPLLIDRSDATEQFSSRLRAVISVMIAGAILVSGMVSLGRWIDALSPDRARRRRERRGPPSESRRPRAPNPDRQPASVPRKPSPSDEPRADGDREVTTEADDFGRHRADGSSAATP